MSNLPRRDFLHPSKKCDIVMKGGITSGIVYPNTVSRLAETYRFVSIGGTSAGAIAAAATAAAEYRRAKGSAEGFEKLSRLPSFLAEKAKGSSHANLFGLFQPDPAARMLFDLGVSFTQKGFRRVLSIIAALLKGAWPVWLVVIVIAALYIWLPYLAPLRESLFERISAGLWLFGILTGGLLVVLIWKLRLLPPKGFGLCSGMTERGSRRPALTAWFHEFVNDLAGKPVDQPLTFGDLNTQGIQLRMISTCLTHRRPYGLPIDSDQFYFRRKDLEEYFPEPVIKWMESHPAPRENDLSDVDEAGFCRLPKPSDMPVLVAARMSLSFPVLFRAVPLYAVDFSLARREKADSSLKPEPGAALQPNEKRVPELCWFLDGGICSNFPIYMFDAPLPRWPTFGIDLQAIRKDRPDSVVWIPSRNAEGFGEQFNRIPDKNGLGPMLEYAAGMIDAARNWTENRQMTVPGYRDRIVHIRLDEGKEGGLNLDMDPAVVAEVSDRGVQAADLLLSHFLYPTEEVSLTWDNHRWIRFRSAFARFEDLLEQIQHGLAEPEPGEASYTELLERGPKERPNSYRVTEHQRVLIRKLMEQLRGANSTVQTAPENSRPSHKQPRPSPALRVLPRTVPDVDADKHEAAPIDPQDEGNASLS
jgi:predicted acylesterase/phospholipase RssA